MITIEWLRDDIEAEIKTIPTLKDVEVLLEGSAIMINWQYDTNSKFDIYDAQVLVDAILKRHQCTWVRWMLNDKRTAINLQTHQNAAV